MRLVDLLKIHGKIVDIFSISNRIPELETRHCDGYTPGK